MDGQAKAAADFFRESLHLLGLYSFSPTHTQGQAEYDLGHMQLDPQLKGNVRFAYYPSGHMVYLNPEALGQMKADLARFYDEAAPR